MAQFDRGQRAVLTQRGGSDFPLWREKFRRLPVDPGNDGMQSGEASDVAERNICSATRRANIISKAGGVLGLRLEELAQTFDDRAADPEIT